jgi:hypothetical protein
VAAKEAADWIKRNMRSNLLYARPAARANESNDLSNLIYSFDNGMILVGLLSLYKITKNSMLLHLSEEMAQVIIKRFFDGEKLDARLDASFRPIKLDKEVGIVKWSTVPGAYHCKLSIALLELERLTGDKRYGQVSDSLCNFAKKLQKSNGCIVTNPGSDTVYLHPHLYGCEGLIYSGIIKRNNGHYAAGLNGIKWAIKKLSSSEGGLLRDTGQDLVEQSDCTAQLLRLLILCQSELEKTVKKSELRLIIDRLHLRLLDFYIPIGEGAGGMKYQLNLETACSWCTMFTMQAMRLWQTKSSGPTWIEYFV